MDAEGCPLLPLLSSEATGRCCSPSGDNSCFALFTPVKFSEELLGDIAGGAVESPDPRFLLVSLMVSIEILSTQGSQYDTRGKVHKCSASKKRLSGLQKNYLMLNYCKVPCYKTLPLCAPM